MVQFLTSQVAGSFFSADSTELSAHLHAFLSEVTIQTPVPKAMIVPHAGYVYSGLTAAHAYAALKDSAYRRVVLLGPSHRYLIEGIGLPQADYYQTPLGDIPLDQTAIQELLKTESQSVIHSNTPFMMPENSLETQLPFLQTVLNDFQLLPILVGQISYKNLAALLEPFLQDTETLFVISSDLSHYQSYEAARTQDMNTIHEILNNRPDDITFEDACGRTGIQAFLTLAEKYHLRAALIDYRNSGDTAGPKNQVVGYAAIHFYEGEKEK